MDNLNKEIIGDLVPNVIIELDDTNYVIGDAQKITYILYEMKEMVGGIVINKFGSKSLSLDNLIDSNVKIIGRVLPEPKGYEIIPSNGIEIF